MARHLKTSINFFKLSENKNIQGLSNIDGIGETQINSIKKFFFKRNNINVLVELNKILTISSAVTINKSGLLKNKTFMLTGKLDGISRGEAKSLIEKNSGKIVSNVNKKLDYLIIGEKPTVKKISLAKALKTSVINQQEWMKMLNKVS